MDPTELGFQFKDQAQIFGQDGQKQRLQHSREKGLKPLLIFAPAKDYKPKIERRSKVKIYVGDKIFEV